MSGMSKSEINNKIFILIARLKEQISLLLNFLNLLSLIKMLKVKK